MTTAVQYASFAMAAYGAIYYVYLDPQPGRLAQLCCGHWCPGLCRCLWGAPEQRVSSIASRRVVTSNAAAVMNKNAICDIAGITHDDLMYVSSSNEFNETVPYFIALDRGKKVVVISIRGTLRCVSYILPT
jgi:sn1-specific diacylglycerol lipase